MTVVRNDGERSALSRVAVHMSLLPLFLMLMTLSTSVVAHGAEPKAVASSEKVAHKSAQAGEQDERAAQAVLTEALLKADIRIDLAAKVCSVPARILVRNELLEFLLVGPHGAAHESLLSTPVQPSLLNTALLALGVEPGQNVRYIEPAGSTPVPKQAESKRGRRREDSEAATVVLPTGDGFYLYLLWKEAGEVYFQRVEDLIRNLKTGRTMRRHHWVYLGSRFAEFEAGQPEQFVADREGNLINIAFFGRSNSLITSAIEDCREQTIWIANPWMLPERGWPTQFIFSRKPLASPPQAWIDALTDPMETRSSENAESSK